ncbi:MAG: hypothetical protein LCH66_13885 [Actinobacteria bacterium]|nr:hypothetical protein [Actinomycetota bacterium]
MPCAPDRPRRRLPWKWIGLAGVAGLAATGAVIARAERQRTAYTPDQVRERLRERHARATADVSE